MEDKDLRQLWNKSFDKYHQKQFSPAEISGMLRKKSIDIIAKYKRTIIVEYGLSLVLGLFVAVLGYFNFEQKESFLFEIFLIVVVVYYSFFCIKSIRKLNRTQTDIVSIQYFKRMISVMKSFEKHYKLMNYIFIPIALILGVILGVFKAKVNLLDDYLQVGSILIMLFVAGIPIILLTNIYIKYFYTRKIIALQEVINDLEQEG